MATNPLWVLTPWAVFAVAAGVKFWHPTSLFRRHLHRTLPAVGGADLAEGSAGGADAGDLLREGLLGDDGKT